MERRRTLSKICTKCGIDKELSEFPRMGGKNNKYLHSWCKKCKNRKSFEHRANRRKRGIKDGWNLRNPEKVSKTNRNWRQRNPERLAYYHAFRKELVSQMPPWADKEKIAQFYIIVSNLNQNEKRHYSVDHIVPLNGDTVSGLHVETNLQILSFAENSGKGNKFE